jgi:hypothetical protein
MAGATVSRAMSNNLFLIAPLLSTINEGRGLLHLDLDAVGIVRIGRLHNDVLHAFDTGDTDLYDCCRRGLICFQEQLVRRWTGARCCPGRGPRSSHNVATRRGMMGPLPRDRPPVVPRSPRQDHSLNPDRTLIVATRPMALPWPYPYRRATSRHDRSLYPDRTPIAATRPMAAPRAYPDRRDTSRYVAQRRGTPRSGRYRPDADHRRDAPPESDITILPQVGPPLHLGAGHSSRVLSTM